MKSVGTILSILLLSCACVLAHPTSDDSFVVAWKKAIETKDLAAVEKLTYLEGLTEENRKLILRADRFAHVGEIKEVTLEPLPSDFLTTHVANGKKMELLKPPIGLIKVHSKGAWSIASPYAIVDGKYYVVGGKITDLNWQGPPDVAWNYFVKGKGSENIEVEYSWNASGVDMTRKMKHASNGFVGQHINWIKVTSNDPNSEISLELLQGSNDFYKSETLKGLGVIEYKKPN